MDMFNTLTRFHLSCAFHRLSLHRALTLAHWSPTSCIRVHTRCRSLATSTEKTRKRAPYSYHKLLTLKPEQFSTVDQEIIDLSGKNNATTHPVSNGPVEKVEYMREAAQPPSRSGKRIPFPEDTKGFFYYHTAPDEPELSAGVRFRICDSAAQFEHGRDLLEPIGDVWGYKLAELVKNRERAGFLSMLRAENLITEELINDINKLDVTKGMGHSLYSLSDPFNVNVAFAQNTITVITRQKLVRIDFPQHAFHDTTKFSRPLTGSIRVQFKLSNLPEHKVLGPTLIIQVLDIVKPITIDPRYKGDTVSVPQPGTLLSQNKRVVYVQLRLQPMFDDLLELVKVSRLSFP